MNTTLMRRYTNRLMKSNVSIKIGHTNPVILIYVEVESTIQERKNRVKVVRCTFRKCLVLDQHQTKPSICKRFDK